MGAKYTIINRVDPLNPEGPRLKYMSNKSDGLIDTRELAEYIAQRSGVSVGHVQGIIEDLGEELQNALYRGETIDLGPIGILTMNVTGEGTATAEEYTTANIKRTYIHLRCRKQLLNKLKDIKFDKVSYSKDVKKV